MTITIIKSVTAELNSDFESVKKKLLKPKPINLKLKLLVKLKLSLKKLSQKLSQ